MTTTDLSRFDSDPDALAWARQHVQRAIDRARQFDTEAAGRDDTPCFTWAHIARYMEQKLIGGQNCVIAAFDERKPTLAQATTTGAEEAS